MGFIAILIGASRPIVSERPDYPPPYLFHEKQHLREPSTESV
nr:MAG TPA: hypothetical protein [Caudoviricetes sp.]